MPWLKQGAAANRLNRNSPMLQRLRRRPAVLFAALFAVVSGVVLLNASSAETQPVTLYLTPDVMTVAPNGEFSLQLRVNSGSIGINAVQADIDYPAELVQLLGVESAGSRFTTVGPGSSAAGSVVVTRGAEGSVSGDQSVATLRFRALAQSASAAVISFQGSSYVYEAGGQSDVLGGLRATRGTTLRIDGEPPVVTVTAPTADAVIRAGRPVSVTVDASDDISSVKSVELYVNSVKIGTEDEPPYDFKWNTAGYSAGSRHTLHAQAIDAHGNVGASQTLTVTLAR